MSYSSEINSNIINVSKNVAEQFLNSLFAGTIMAGGPNNISFNTEGHTGNDGKNVYSGTIHNTTRNKTFYNLYDLIASAKANGATNTDIATALNTAYNTTDWNANTVKDYNTKTTAYTEQLQKYLTQNYSEFDPYVTVRMNKTGTDYEVYVAYKDPTNNNKLVYTKVNEPSAGRNSEYKPDEINNIIGSLKATSNGLSLPELSTQISNKNTVNTQLANNKAASDAINDLLGKPNNDQSALDNINSLLGENSNKQSEINSALSSLTNTAGTAKTNYNLSDADRQAMVALMPDQSTQKVGNAVNDSSWIDNLGKDLGSTNAVTFKGRNLQEHLNNAQVGNDALDEYIKAYFNKANDNLLTDLKSKDTAALIKALNQQQQSDLRNNVVAGQMTANAGNVTQQANATAKEAADKLYESLVGSDNSLPAQQREGVYQNLVDAITNYTTQQLSQMNADQQNFSTDVAQLTSAAQSIQDLINAEMMKANREASDERTRAGIAQSDIISANDTAAALSRSQDQASSQAARDVANKLTSLISDSANQDITGALKTLLDNVKSGAYDNSTATKVTHDYTNFADHIDETTYNRLINSGIMDFLTQDAYNRYTTSKNAAELADAYDVEYLTNQNATIGLFEEAAKQANEASDKTFNAAQRAYISAIAAGDAVTAQQLTRLANSAGMAQRELYNTQSALNQLTQQQNNRTVGNSMAQDRAMQQATNKKQLADANATGANSWTQWNGQAGDYENSLYSAQKVSGQNAAAGKDAYSVIAGAGLGSQSNWNNLVSEQNNESNRLISDAAKAITANNATNAASNIITSATNKSTKLGLKTQQQVLKDQEERLKNIAKTGVIS